uniref:HTH CENPB-type domain-containing protein n=1 Tax=Globisporangium ultimum (strain ATCC 200006 / CBS 805.95 / DAOM BR144) TaxID=431595 RepID=K3WI56_GLOUD
MGWLQVFQDKYNLPTYEKPSENAAQTTGAKRGRDEFGTFNGSNRPGPSIEHRSKRARMTYGEKAQLYAYHLANPSVTRYWLGEWAASQFNLVTVPSESSISKLLRKQREIHENPDRMAEGIDGTSSFMNTDARKKTYKVTCPALESELIRWIYECRSRGEQVGGKLVQQKAHALRDLLLQENRPDIDHNALAAMTFSQGWLYRFQTKFELLTRRNKTKAKKKELSRPKYLLRTHMTLEEKERLYEQYQTDPSMKMTALADWATNEFKLAKPPSRSTMSGIIKRYKERLAAGINTEDEDSPIQRADAATRKKYTTVVCPQLEKELLKWVLSCKMKGENVSGKAIAAKAAALRDELLTEQRYHPRHEVLADMTFSNGWLYRFQQRYGIFSRAKRSTTTSVRTVRKNPAARGRVTKKR